MYRAPFVVPVTAPPIADGAVLVHEGRILAVGPYPRLRNEATRIVDVEEAIITPALINCHAHLELSYLAEAANRPSAESDGPSASFRNFTDWIREVLNKRCVAVEPNSIVAVGREELDRQYQRGVALVADIGNLPTSREIGVGGRCETMFFRELLAVTEKAAGSVLSSLAPAERCTAHAPYSCHPSLLKSVKSRARESGALFPIHLAESAAEVEFLRTGSGPFDDFLRERLRTTGALAVGDTLAEVLPCPGCGAVEYLHSLQILDARTICVHTVHVTKEEVGLLAQTRAKLCLCPGSNRKLGVGKAPLPWFLERQLLPGLGTDSLASNDRLDLWREMQILQEDHPAVEPERIFAMATAGGAATLGVSDRLGVLAPGHHARLLAVAFTGSETDIFPHLVNSGTALKVSWLEGGHA